MKIVSLLLFLTLSLFSRTHIMPLGDSITYDDAYRDHPELGGSSPRPASERYAYRSFLWYKLHDAGYDFSFVGSRSAGSAIRPAFDPDNEGYPGETSSYIASHVYGFLQNNPADIILLHIGTNDHSTSVSKVNSILNEIDRYESNYHHHIKVILAKLIQRREYDSTIHSFNNNIQSLANSRKNSGDDIYLVDMENDSGISSSNYQDRTHPNDTGYRKMANVWYSALRRVLSTGGGGSDTDPNALAKPTEFKASQITYNSVKLTWKDNSTAETKFKINDGNTPLVRVGTDVTEVTIYDLEPNTNYTLSIRSSNSDGTSEMVYVTFRTLESIPSKPTSFTTSKIDAHSITLQWDDNSDNEQGFKIWSGDTRVATLGANVTSTTITDLQANTTYTFEIRSYNSHGNSSLQTITIKTKDDYAWLPAVYHVILY